MSREDTETPVTRRDFISTTAKFAAGLMVGAHLSWPIIGRAFAAGASSGNSGVEFNSWIHISPSGAIEFIMDKAEMGQGILTTLTAIVAEELGVDPSSINVSFAPPDSKYVNPKLFFTQITGGSTSIAASWDPLRRAAATARYALIQTASKKLNTSPGNCQFVGDRVVDGATGKNLPFASIVGDAGALASQLDPKDPAIQPKFRLKSELGGQPAPELKYIGKPMPRLDAHAKVTGTAGYGIDVTEVESLGVQRKVLNCVVVRCPVPGGKLKDFTPKAVTGDGIRFVVPLKNGVAIVADSYWQALKASKQLHCEWDPGSVAKWSTPSLRKDFIDSLDSSGILVHKDPWYKLETVMNKEVDWSGEGITAVYETPYLPHSPMEPMNCTAWVQDNHCEIWVPTQAPAAAREIARQITGLDLEKITVHNTFIGGSFGRRIYQDFVAEAVQISKWAKAPVKVIWSREDDFKHDYYRPATIHRVKGKMGSDGAISHWLHHTVGQSIFEYVTSAFVDSLAVDIVSAKATDFVGNTMGNFFTRHIGKLGIADPTSVEGIVTDSTIPDSLETLPYLRKIPYAIDNFCLEYTPKNPGIPVGFFRSVGHSHTAFVVECFIDELAHQSGKDPFQFRMDLLNKAKATRNLRVLQLVAEKSGWGNGLPPGHFHGIAQHESFGTLVAHVVEISIQDGQPKVHRVTSAVDCGFVLNPDTIEAQIQGAVIFGMSAALKQEITIKDGEVEQSRFDQCDPVRMFESPPEIDVYIVPSDDAPTGIGEPGVPPIAPAICNAVFAATGKRIRSLPIRI